MASSNLSPAADVGEIQQRMAQIRREMHEDVQGAVREAQSLTDWRSIVGSHPWAALGVAAGVGYLVVPHRKAEAAAFYAPSLAQDRLLAASEQKSRGFRPMGMILGMIAPILMRAAQNYASNYLEQWLESHPMPVSGPDMRDRPAPPEDEIRERGPRTVRFPN